VETTKPTSNKNFAISVRNALRGICVAFGDSGHLRFHFAMAVIFLALGFYFGLTSYEWLVLVLIIAAVIFAEIVNTCFEDIENVIRDHAGVPYEFTGKAKDMASGAVLVLSIAAVAIGIVIFYQRLLGLF